MTNRILLAYLGLAVSLSAVSSLARADEPDHTTQEALASVISQQIDAFGRDDAETAQSFAVPELKSKFSDPATFLAMVRQAYSPLIHPRSLHFNPASRSDLGPMQSVTVIDKDGEVWTATYLFTQVDGQWRISGCVLSREQSTPI